MNEGLMGNGYLGGIRLDFVVIPQTGYEDYEDAVHDHYHKQGFDIQKQTPKSKEVEIGTPDFLVWLPTHRFQQYSWLPKGKLSFYVEAKTRINFQESQINWMLKHPDEVVLIAVPRREMVEGNIR